MAVAYIYAEDGSQPEPAALVNLRYVRKFGVHATFGRAALRAREARSMEITETIITAYQARTHAEDWVRWAQEHPADNALLNRAMPLAERL